MAAENYGHHDLPCCHYHVQNLHPAVCWSMSLRTGPRIGGPGFDLWHALGGGARPSRVAFHDVGSWPKADVKVARLDDCF